jgi:hypothetical protein
MLKLLTDANKEVGLQVNTDKATDIGTETGFGLVIGFIAHFNIQLVTILYKSL